MNTFELRAHMLSQVSPRIIVTFNPAGSNAEITGDPNAALNLFSGDFNRMMITTFCYKALAEFLANGVLACQVRELRKVLEFVASLIDLVETGQAQETESVLTCDEWEILKSEDTAVMNGFLKLLSGGYGSSDEIVGEISAVCRDRDEKMPEIAAAINERMTQFWKEEDENHGISTEMVDSDIASVLGVEVDEDCEPAQPEVDEDDCGEVELTPEMQAMIDNLFGKLSKGGQNDEPES